MQQKARTLALALISSVDDLVTAAPMLMALSVIALKLSMHGRNKLPQSMDSHRALRCGMKASMETNQGGLTCCALEHDPGHLDACVSNAQRLDRELPAVLA